MAYCNRSVNSLHNIFAM